MATLFCTGLSICNLGALTSWAYQFPGLCGKDGITPLADELQVFTRAFALDDNDDPDGEAANRSDSGGKSVSPAFGRIKARFRSALATQWTPKRARQWQAIRAAPTLFILLGASSYSVAVVFTAGFLACAGLLYASLAPWLWPQAYAYPPAVVAGPCAIIYALVYLSFTNLGSPWLSLQFETLLVEANAWFGVLYCLSPASPSPWVWCMRWLGFRLMLGAGVGKIAGGDPAWRDGRAMTWHYETQPLPNPFSRLAHRAPEWWHKWETALTFGPEGLVPLLLFWGPPWQRLAGFILTAAFNGVIALTGNYGHLHLLTVTIASTLIIETNPRGPEAGVIAGPGATVTSEGVAAGSGGATAATFVLPTLLSGPLNTIAAQVVSVLSQGTGLLVQALPEPAQPATQVVLETLQSMTGSVMAGAGTVISTTVSTWPPRLACSPAPPLFLWTETPPYLGLHLGWRDTPLALLAWVGAAAAWGLLATYVALSSVPLARNFDGLMELTLSLPGWPSVKKAWKKALPWHVAGVYNLFAHMTRARWELEYEVSADNGQTWYEIGFAAKPGGPPAALDRVPPLLPPGHIPRLDWRVWFLPLVVQRMLKRGVPQEAIPSVVQGMGRSEWHRAFMERLLQGSAPVLRLLRFPPQLAGRERSLTHVRCLIYAYHFSDGQTNAAEVYGAMWSSVAPGSAVQLEAARAAGQSAATGAGAASAAAAPSTIRGDDSSANDDEDTDDGAGSEDDGAQGQLEAQAQAAPAVSTATPAAGNGCSTGTTAAAAVDSSATSTRGPSYRTRSYGQWDEGRVWRRKFVCVYDAVSRSPLAVQLAVRAAERKAAEAAAAASWPTRLLRTVVSAPARWLRALPLWPAKVMAIPTKLHIEAGQATVGSVAADGDVAGITGAAADTPTRRPGQSSAEAGSATPQSPEPGAPTSAAAARGAPSSGSSSGGARVRAGSPSAGRAQIQGQQAVRRRFGGAGERATASAGGPAGGEPAPSTRQRLPRPTPRLASAAAPAAVRMPFVPMGRLRDVMADLDAEVY